MSVSYNSKYIDTDSFQTIKNILFNRSNCASAQIIFEKVGTFVWSFECKALPYFVFLPGPVYGHIDKGESPKPTTVVVRFPVRFCIV